MTALFSLLAAAGLWSWWQIRLLGDVRLHLGAFYGWFALIFAVYLAALWIIRRMERAHDGTPPSWKVTLVVVLLAAAAFRLVMIGTAPALSDDIYRYQWDGRVQLAGIDPHRYPPNDPALATLRDDAWAHINFPHLRTVYPPPTQQAFRFGAWLGSEWSVSPQHGVTLGERMAQAIDRAFTEGMRRVAVIGTDSPWIDHPLIEEAFAAMEQADLVIGPARDGGYYLVGLTKPAPEIFSGIPWSTDRVLRQTLANACALDLSVSLLPEGYDIDRLTDLQRWMQADPHHGVTVPLSAKQGAAPRNRRMSHA